MAYGTPADPVAGTVITVAYAVSNLLNPIRALRAFTGGVDPPGSNYVVTSDSTSATSWKTMVSAVLGALGYTPVNRAGDTVPFLNFTSYLAWTVAANHVWTSTVSGNALVFTNATTGTAFAVTSAGVVTVAGGVVWTSANDAALAHLSGAAFTGSISAINNVTAVHSGPAAGAVLVNKGGGASATIMSPTATGTQIYNSAIGGPALFIPDALASSILHNGLTMWDAGNDGTGSTLDADLLDGVQGSGYALIANQVPSGAVVFFETLAELTAAGAPWARYTAADGLLLIGAGTSLGQAFAQATTYGTTWATAGHMTVNANTLDVAGSTDAAPTVTNMYDAGTATGSGVGHVHGSTGLSITGTPALGNLGTLWAPPARAGIWGRKT